MNKWRKVSVLTLMLGVLLAHACQSRLHAAELIQVTDALGRSVSLPAQPQRIVALGELDLDCLLALGIQPVATTAGRGQLGVAHYLQSQRLPDGQPVSSLPLVGLFSQPSLDKLIQVRPDLILTSSVLDPRVLAQLSQVAPTLFIAKPEEPWKTVFSRLAGWLGREETAQAFLAEYQARAGALQARWADRADRQISIVRWDPKGPGFMQADSFASLVARDAGLSRPVAQQVPGVKHSPPLSLEALSSLDGDWLFMGVLDPKGQQAQTLDQLASQPLFARLKAVQAGHLVLMDGSMWTSNGGPLAALGVQQDLAAALDGAAP
ncbi:iron-siderophore ABC transporter substrate-binding protein [Pseudaeromonas paramecii]|uniref:Amonabactin ABC transporter substrate-binding protein n=1 Tax=Pseudaeromonas paramecii TaxID=2138166 RepID=A0ABP8Q3U8_9GAMM